MALHTGHTPHSNYDKCSRALKALWVNFPTHVNICWFLLHIRNRTFSSSFMWEKFGTMRANLENRFSLTGWSMVQSITKCLSSSRTWQIEQLWSSIFVFPVCQGMRTGSQLRHGDSIFMFLNRIQIYFYAQIMFKPAIGSQNTITVNALNLFHPRVDEPICYTLFTFKFEFRG